MRKLYGLFGTALVVVGALAVLSSTPISRGADGQSSPGPNRWVGSRSIGDYDPDNIRVPEPDNYFDTSKNDLYKQGNFQEVIENLKEQKSISRTVNENNGRATVVVDEKQ